MGTEWFDTFFKSFGPQHGALAAGCAILGGLINQVLTNQQKIREMKLTTEEKHFALTLDEATTIRKELRESVTRLEGELSACQKEVFSWQSKYYELKESNVKLTAGIEALQKQVDDMKSGAHT